MEPFCLGKPAIPGGPVGVMGGLCKPCFGCAYLQPMARSSAFVREVELGLQALRDWVRAGVFRRMFEAVAADPHMENAMVGAAIIKVRRHGQGAKGGLRARPSASPRAA